MKATYRLSPGTILEIAQGDLTKEPVDAIVNAANEHLSHGGGVAAAISRAGGPSIQEESNEWVRRYGEVTHGEPALTGAGKMPARYVIHAVGPIWGVGEEDARLIETLRGTLALAERLELESIAFPAISTGIYRFPVARAAGVFFNTFKTYFAENSESTLKTVRITLWDDETTGVFLTEGQRALGELAV